MRINSKCGVHLIKEFLFATEVEEGQISTVNSQSLVRMILKELKSLKEADQDRVAEPIKKTISALQRNLQ